ncbi:hypothetical protein F0P96_03870 [Hymenobacter busanensis]|uniref:Uncharacterized protein n=1 Tax=Hymenobacter busanensis TaxID=2607656 RepID=A0A7L4ZWA0_9BACT|nr:hypothetical protein [Hymenobacter busanensis]KAA9339763.1 hypothetical protein F0P96_03870 [Hymenobacter busanensis]QHJ06482.1 hypothetical protein GUY19_03875 [Hymenobacter busanensis]
MAVKLNPEAVSYAQQLIRAGKVLHDEGHWGEHNPDTKKENAYLEKHEYAEYGKWHLGVDASAGEDTKDRYKFPVGDFQKLHRDGLIAAKERAAQQGYRDIETAADELLQLVDKTKK